jgi:hypothetical protein
MKVPPCLVAMRIAEQGRTKFRLWLPLFVLWPLLLAVLMLILLGSLIADVAFLALGRRGSYTRLIIGCLGVVGETRGVEVFVTDNSRTVAFTVR